MKAGSEPVILNPMVLPSSKKAATGGGAETFKDYRLMIAGLTRPQDAALALELGATDLACELVPESPRCVTPERAREIFAVADRSTGKILHFRSANPDTVIAAAKAAGCKQVMLTACTETDAETCEAAGLTVLRVHEVATGTNMLPPMLPEPNKKQPGVLTVSTSVPDLTFPWEILGNEAPLYTYIGGAVRPENVCALITHRPYGIIVNSGVEREPGIKDADRLALLFDTLENGF